MSEIKHTYTRDPRLVTCGTCIRRYPELDVATTMAEGDTDRVHWHDAVPDLDLAETEVEPHRPTYTINAWTLYEGLSHHQNTLLDKAKQLDGDARGLMLDAVIALQPILTTLAGAVASAVVTITIEPDDDGGS